MLRHTELKRSGFKWKAAKTSMPRGSGFKSHKSVSLGRKAETAKKDRAWAKAVKERDDYTCRRCGRRGEMDAHHIAMRSQRPDLRWIVANGVALDRRCHGYVHEHREESIAMGFLSDETYEAARKAA